MMMQTIADLRKEVPIPSVLVEVVYGVGDQKDHGFLETLLVVHPLLGVGILIREQSKFPAVNHDESIQRK